MLDTIKQLEIEVQSSKDESLKDQSPMTGEIEIDELEMAEVINQVDNPSTETKKEFEEETNVLQEKMSKENIFMSHADSKILSTNALAPSVQGFEGEDEFSSAKMLKNLEFKYKILQDNHKSAIEKCKEVQSLKEEVCILNVRLQEFEDAKKRRGIYYLGLVFRGEWV